MGYALLMTLFEEGEVLNVALHPDYRGRGLSKHLMQALLLAAKEKGAQILYLEVRASNAPARSLYEQFGFSVVGVRKDYYSLPREDALLMTKFFS